MNLENNPTPLSEVEIHNLAEEIVQERVNALEDNYGITVELTVINFLLRLTKSILQSGENLNSIEDVERIIRHLNPDNVPTTPTSGDIESYLAPRCAEKAANEAIYRNPKRIKPLLEEIKERDCDQFSPDLESIQACLDYKEKADVALGLIG